ncbi:MULTISPECIES: hypothetical protein [unclassified Anabaena]|uniref:hypothetical protein n=1 Tax=unclassified Anabaena TaxID=2619674 RepID=UPI002B1F3C69|nr:hypothetical protein [Anabaena sp. UHCC 0399]MEA5566563.1 hypothetical protein [Anabaena sp. UHCC 0399]
MNQDNVYHDYNLALKMVAINSSDGVPPVGDDNRNAQLKATLVEISQKPENAISNIQSFITKQRVYFWQILSALTYLIFCSYLLLFVNVLIDTWASKITQASPYIRDVATFVCVF